MAEFSGPQNGKGPDPVQITLQRVSFRGNIYFVTLLCGCGMLIFTQFISVVLI
jgi:hypothetical protein